MAAHGNRRTVATWVSVALLSTVVVVAAVDAEGTKATNVELDDASVWVSNQSTGQVGRLNTRSDELDLAKAAGADADVLQWGRDVVHTSAAGGIDKLDVTTGAGVAHSAASLPDYQVSGDLATLLDPTTGRLWVGPSSSMVGSEFPKGADAELPTGSRIALTVGRDTERGKVLVVEPTQWFELELDSSGKPLRDEPQKTTDTTGATAPEATVAEDVPAPIKPPRSHVLKRQVDESTAITTVGDDLAFLGPDGEVFFTNGSSATIPGESAVLQQPGPKNDAVLVASTAGLFEVGIGSTTAKQLAQAAGAPAAPVRVGSCVFGAWSSAQPTWFKACDGRAVTPVSPITKAPADARLVFRVNQRNVALNSVGDGGVWSEHEGQLAFVGNWQEATDQTDNLNNDAQGSSVQVAEKQCVEGGADPPTAGKDQLGARPRPSIIDVLYNDDDVNCEPIAIAADSLSPASGDWGSLTVIDNGQHLLFSPSQGIVDTANKAPQTISFTYAVDDSSGHRSAPAEVLLTVCGTETCTNRPPELRPKGDGTTRQMRATVEENHSTSYSVFGDWWDPDGDDLVLAGASAEQGEVSSSPDGVVRYSAVGVGPGAQNVEVTVSDGIGSATEPLEVMVKALGTAIPPVVSNDFLTLVEGATGTVVPLANDSDPNEDQLELVPGDWPTDGKGFRWRLLQNGAVEITAVASGVYPLAYEASDGVDRTRGTIRLVVIAPDGSNHAPVAVPDQVKLRADRVVNVDVLANDVDPDGDILAISGVSAPDPTAAGVVRASIVDRRLIQLEIVPGTGGAAPSGVFQVSYSVVDGHEAERAQSDGADEASKRSDSLRAQGVITVTVMDPSKDQPPVATADAVVVRTGDLAAVPVLTNDVDPDGDPLALVGPDPKASELESRGQLVTWASGRSLMVFGEAPGNYTLLYSMSANGKQATGRVAVTVTPPPSADRQNNPPAPRNLVLRAVKGAEVRLPVPVSGIDVDGDSVTLLDSFGDHQGAAAGNTVRLDPGDPRVLLFTASPGSGPTDQFTYSVRDTYGGVGSATVKVVVQENQGWPPVAHDDVLRAKPGRTVYVNLLGNDASPQDLRLAFADNPFFVDGVESATPAHPDSVSLLDQTKDATWGYVAVQVPTDTRPLVENYRVTDGRSQSSAALRLTPDPSAPNVPPVATDDVVKDAEVRGKAQVEVKVLLNDFDPDNVDDSARLRVDLPAGQNAAVDGSGVVTVPLLEQAQIVLYRLTDSDGASTIGVIRVPGKENHPPRLNAAGKNPSQREIEAASTQPYTVMLKDIVEDPDGDPVVLTDTAVIVEGGDAQGTVKRLDTNDGFQYTPPPQAAQSFEATLQFEVTDRPNVPLAKRQEPNCNCLVTLRSAITVKASSPPRVVQPGSVEVPVLDEEVQYDLTPLMVDDQRDALTFHVLDTPAGIDITQSGTGGARLSLVSRDGTLKPGQTFSFRFDATDGNFQPVQNTVTVTIVASNKPAPAAATLPVQEAERDVPFQLPNLVAAASNPFPDKPLSLISPSVDPASASLTCSESGACTFTTTTVGTFTVRYTLQDAAQRQANGSVTVVVKGKPRAPGVPKIESVGDHVVNLTWTPADMQGGTLVTYWVTAVETNQTQSFTTTGGQFTGLTNGNTYHFTVLAENELGKGEPSQPVSSPAIPDRVPDPPVNARITDYGDGKLMLAWDPPPTAGDFTPISAYDVSIGGKTFSTTGATSVTATGLQNGTDYTFRVRAKNAAQVNNGWGDWSAPSAPDRPSRHPDTPAAPTAANSGDGGTPRLTVTWAPPAFDGGRPISSYKVCVYNTTTCQTITTGLQATFNATKNSAMQFTVQAFNTDVHDSASGVSAPSSPVTAVGTPNAPVITSVTSGDHTLTVIASTTNGSGCPSYTIQYQRVGTTTWQTSNVFTGLSNGTSYAFVAKTVLSSSCYAAYESAPSAQASGVPYGPLLAPSIIANLSGNTITWTYSAPRADDGRAGWNWSLSGECAGSGSSAVSNATYSGTFPWGSGNHSCSITVSATGAGSLTAGPATQNVAYSATISLSTQTVSGKRWITGSGSGFPAGARFYIQCSDSSGYFVNTETNTPVVYAAKYVDGAGNLSWGSNICWSTLPVTVRVYTNSPAASASGVI